MWSLLRSVPLHTELFEGGTELQITVRIIDFEHREDIHLPNEPFPIYGRLIPSYINEQWRYTTEIFSDKLEMCFPDENYSYEDMAPNSTFIGAYDKETCIGLAIMQEAYFKYMYLYDLKVNQSYRRSGVAGKLIEMAKEIAISKGYHGIFTQGQDNNLGACLFYLKSGFVIGGLDTKVYQGTAQADKKDIYFYLDF